MKNSRPPTIVEKRDGEDVPFHYCGLTFLQGNPYYVWVSPDGELCKVRSVAQKNLKSIPPTIPVRAVLEMQAITPAESVYHPYYRGILAVVDVQLKQVDGDPDETL